ncbi:hypothetical protein ScPMuIL_010050 [Solemya velum]
MNILCYIKTYKTFYQMFLQELKLSVQLGVILKALSESEITVADVGYGGTQPKLLLTLEGDQKAVFKPKWYERDYIVEGPDPYGGLDRHNGEIVAFHLGR